MLKKMGKESIVPCVTVLLHSSNNSALEPFRYLVQREHQQYWQWYHSSNRVSVFNISKLKVSQHLWKVFMDNKKQINVMTQASKLTHDFMSNQVSIFSACSGKFLKFGSKIYTGITDDVPIKLEKAETDLKNTIWISSPCQRQRMLLQIHFLEHDISGKFFLVLSKASAWC